MAKGDKKPVVMESDRAVPSGIATLDSVGNVPFEQLGNVVRPNLLDNWYFVNPVNQRGKTEYTEEGYTIDRWMKTSSPVVSLTYKGLRLQGLTDYHYVTQLIEKNLNGRSVTLSALFSDGTLLWGSKNVSENLDEVFAKNGWHFIVYLTGGDTCIRIINTLYGADITIVAIKLELGTTQTLAHQDASGNWVLNEIPDYGEELAKCQRYQVVYSGRIPGLAHSFAASGAYIEIATPVPLRAIPTVSGAGNIALIAGAYATSDNLVKCVRAEGGAITANCFYATLSTNSGLTANERYMMTSSGGIVILDANL